MRRATTLVPNSAAGFQIAYFPRLEAVRILSDGFPEAAARIASPNASLPMTVIVHDQALTVFECNPSLEFVSPDHESIADIARRTRLLGLTTLASRRVGFGPGWPAERRIPRPIVSASAGGHTQRPPERLGGRGVGRDGAHRARPRVRPGGRSGSRRSPRGARAGPGRAGDQPESMTRATSGRSGSIRCSTRPERSNAARTGASSGRDQPRASAGAVVRRVAIAARTSPARRTGPRGGRRRRWRVGAGNGGGMGHTSGPEAGRSIEANGPS